MQEEEQKLVLIQQIPDAVTQPKGCLQIMPNEQPPHFCWNQLRFLVHLMCAPCHTKSCCQVPNSQPTESFRRGSLLLTVNLSNIFIQMIKNTSQKCSHGKLVSFHGSW